MHHRTLVDSLPLRTLSSHVAVFLPVLSILLAAVFVAGCEDDDDTVIVVEPPEAQVPTTLEPRDDPPGVNFTITEVAGASGANGAFQPGDRITVTFEVFQNGGESWDLSQLTSVRAMVSGPTFNYQRVLPEENDLVTAAQRVETGVYRYTFPDPIPATYVAPINSSGAFGPGDGVLTGQPLLAGTYTVGLYGYWSYTVQGVGYRDHGDATSEILLGSTTVEVPRDVTRLEHCNQCHVDVQAHGGFRRNVTICLLCHTTGSEDRTSDPVTGTPGVSIDFKVMIHKIHNGSHLPSVLGVTTNPDGSRNYGATPIPYVAVGFSTGDFSHVEFPVWPNLSSPLPRDAGYSDLTPGQQALEDQIRRGAADCEKCHGDPDGDGPIEAPSQGDLAYGQPTRNSCGSCHDDVIWEFPYVANFQTMPPQFQDGTCLICHPTDGTQLATRDVHRHPLNDPSFFPGINFEISSVAEAGDDPNMDETLDPGEKVEVSFFMRDDAGNEIDPSIVSSISVVLSGPTYNSNLVLSTSLSTSVLTGPQPFTTLVPHSISLDFVDESTSTPGETFTTSFVPIRTEGSVTVRIRSGNVGVPTSAASPIAALDNYVDVQNASGLARDDTIVIDEGMPNEEYFLVQHVDGNRVFFSTSQTQASVFSHQMGAIVQEVTLDTLAEGTDYTLDRATGEITEIGDFGEGAVLVSYTSDFVMPDLHPRPLNASPDLGDPKGKFAGKSLADGTYTVTLYTADDLVLSSFGESNSYRAPSTSVGADFLVGAATDIEPYDLISSEENCYSCHADLMFHGLGRRGFAACISCHGTAASEDRPQYVAPNAPATTGVTIDFRAMLHKIHMGEELSQGANYQVIGFGSGFPNNFSVHTYEEVVFPSMPRGPMDCVACHGEDNDAWKEPMVRDHPTEQVDPSRVWTHACLSCHDSTAASAHASAQTDAGGNEGCLVCHGPGRSLEVDLVHKIRQR